MSQTKESELYDDILKRLLADQYTDDPENSRYGEFGRTRTVEDTTIYSGHGEALRKPNMFLTWFAVQTLLELEPQNAGFNIKIAGEFAERRMGANGFVEVIEAAQNKADSSPVSGGLVRYIHFRHTIAAAFVLLLLGNRVQYVRSTLEFLISENIQNDDGGWPISHSSDEYKHSDLWTSAYTSLFLYFCLAKKVASTVQSSDVQMAIEKTLGYFLMKYFEGGWSYKVVSDKLETSSALYVLLAPILYGRKKSRIHPLFNEAPKYLLKCVKNGTLVNCGKDDFNKNQIYAMMVKAAFALRFAIRSDSLILKTYWEIRQSLLENYSHLIPLSAYDLCCLMIMIKKDRLRGKKIKLMNLWDKIGPIMKHAPIVGKPIDVASDLSKLINR